MRAKHEEEKAPTREMNKSSFGTEIATRTVHVMMCQCHALRNL